MNVMSIPNYRFLKKKIKANSKHYKLLRKCIVEGNRKAKEIHRDLRFASYWMETDETKKQLLDFYSEFYSNIDPPKHSNKVWIATGNGGVFVGFYENGWKSWYGGEGRVDVVKALVLKWWEYDEYKGVK